ncbi:hypothetical protein HY214_01940 [Candidatus Roizmanbacteria bacterium]|nr:hypothetical protein [Candidatus Roizmanbacteria bacterium]
MNARYVLKTLLIFCTFVFFIYVWLTKEAVFIKSVDALNMDSAQYKIKAATINIAGGSKSSANYKLNDTLGQLAANQFSASGFYIVKAGFQYVSSLIPFSFSISNTSLNLGSLVSGTNGSSVPTTLTVSFGAAGQYQVTVIEEGQLQTLNGVSAIPDTVCDNGNCTVSSAQPWVQSSTYGFGYTMTGQDISADFTDGTYYRPFPNRATSGSPAVIMSNSNVGRNRQATFRTKANVGPTQPAGTYQTVLNFVATPSY